MKTNSTRRTLPLNPHIREMLLEKKDMDKHYKKLCGKEYNTEFEGFACCAPLNPLCGFRNNNYMIYCDKTEDEIERIEKERFWQKTVEISGRSQLYDFTEVSQKP